MVAASKLKEYCEFLCSFSRWSCMLLLRECYFLVAIYMPLNVTEAKMRKNAHIQKPSPGDGTSQDGRWLGPRAPTGHTVSLESGLCLLLWYAIPARTCLASVQPHTQVPCAQFFCSFDASCLLFFNWKFICTFYPRSLLHEFIFRLLFTCHSAYQRQKCIKLYVYKNCQLEGEMEQPWAHSKSPSSLSPAESGQSRGSQ
jgi:hypothetical protein